LNPVQARDVADNSTSARVECPGCGEFGVRTLFRGRDRLFHTTDKSFLLVECKNCRLIRLEPRPTPQELSRYYPPEYWFAPEDDAASKIEEQYRRFVLRDHVNFVMRAMENSGENGLAVDVGCGGGRTINKLAAIAAQGKVHGIDYSEESVAASRRYNAQAIRFGRVAIYLADVGKLPFQDNTFDLVTGVETHFWWSDIAAGLREIRRVLKPGGALILIAEVYKDADTTMSRLCEKYAPITGMKMLTSDEHRDLLASVGFADVRIDALAAKGWITAQGRK